MSKSISPRLKNPDWNSLFAQATEYNRPLSEAELKLWKTGVIDGNQRIWAVDYVDACYRAVEGREPADMLALLRQEVPPPPFLLPVLAHYISTKEQGLVSGRATKITMLQRRGIQETYRRKIEHHLIEADRDFDRRISGEIGQAIKKTFSTADLRRVRFSQSDRAQLAKALGCDETHLLRYVTKSTPTPREWIADMAAVFCVSPKTIERCLKQD